MNHEEYTENVTRLEPNYGAIHPKTTSSEMRLLHAAMGMSTETNEVLDALKKSMFHGKQMDHLDMLEELGDILWYMTVMMDELGFTMDQVIDRNICKLKVRHGLKFSEGEA
jgi:NTP pyrophosphatase (non-canonical NTP hydrolase)